MLTIDSYWYAHVRSSGQILQERSGDPRGHFLPAVLLSHRKSLRDLWFPREGWCGPFLLQPWWVGFRTRGWWEESFASGESGGGAPISGKGTSAKITKWHVLTRSARMSLGISAKVGWKWKWSNGVFVKLLLLVIIFVILYAIKELGSQSYSLLAF